MRETLKIRSELRVLTLEKMGQPIQNASLQPLAHEALYQIVPNALLIGVRPQGWRVAFEQLTAVAPDGGGAVRDFRAR